MAHQHTAEHTRLEEAHQGLGAWKRWGPYLSERQWGTVREDYSENGDAWNYFTHDQARSRAYRWGEDGLAGICDDRQLLCFAIALWNGKDSILKERLFGLTNSEGNHGEDVKEYYFYLDSTPTHSYMKYLYKYPQDAYPYETLKEENRKRSRQEFEYELIDTGVFSGGRYFDVFVEYAKASPEDLLAQIDLDHWLVEHGAGPFKAHRRKALRNERWHHMRNAHIISMPDKWEYPWYAAWDLAFHVLALTLVDPEFGKEQLLLMLHERYLHPSGRLPAYEWNFGEVNPPVHAFATCFTYAQEVAHTGHADVVWLERVFQKLALNFTWWVNRKDRLGNNAFEGGFLGLDNIGVFDRSAPLPTGGHLEQADGTAWMALFCQNMVEISAELALHRPAYGDMCVKFVEHFLWIATSMMNAGDGTGMWDEEDGFFYDVLRFPDGRAERLKVRSMVGLLPLCAATVLEESLLDRLPVVHDRLRSFLEARPKLRAFIHDPAKRGHRHRLLASILDERKLRRVLELMLDEGEFLSPFGIRALSRYHKEHPYLFRAGEQEYRVPYLPAESDTGMFGGNSNWRGPIWAPLNALLIRGLLQYYVYYGNDFTIECPTGSGRQMTLYQVAEEIARRLASIFVRDAQGRRPVYGGTKVFQEDPHWRDLVLFYEYFHGDNGAGLGASHQTGWTGVIARLMHLFGTTSAEQYLQLGKLASIEVDSKVPQESKRTRVQAETTAVH
jgi:hypothetical protein